MGNHNIASLASLSCFSQNLNAYNFSSKENMIVKLHIMTHFETFFLGTEFPLILKSRGPGTSSSMKLGVLFVFQGSSDYYRSFFIFSEFLRLFPKRFSYVICSHNYIFSRLTSSPCYNKFT